MEIFGFYLSCCFINNLLYLGGTGLLALLLHLIFIYRSKAHGYEPLIKHLLPGKVEPSSERNGGELVAEVLQQHGVKFIYTLCGGHVSPILVESEKLKIRIIDTRHEATAVFAAGFSYLENLYTSMANFLNFLKDATARLSGNVGIAVVTAGPGVTNTVTALKNAAMAESPLILLGGAAATLAKGRGALQDIEQIGLLKTVCKASYSVQAIRQIIPVLREAFQVAASGTPGPVFVELPIDVLYPYKVVSKEVILKQPKNILQWIASKYITHHLNYVFGDAFKSQISTPLPIDVPMADRSQISVSADLIRNSKKPVILVGSQATLLHTTTSIDEIQKSLETLSIPCFLGGMARGLLGKSHSIQMRHKRRDALRDADLVILAGSICDFRLGYGRSLPKKGKIISINRNKEKMLMNSKQFWTCTQSVQSDVGFYLKELSRELQGYKCDPTWVSTLRKREDEREIELEKSAEKITDVHLNPIKVLKALDQMLPQNAIIVADGGDFVGSAAYILRPRAPLSWLDPGPFGTLGVGGGFALGAKLCNPEKEVWIVYGDGSCGYSIMEYDTFVRHKTPVISIIGNDAGWTQIAREQVPMLGSDTACRLSFSNYHEIPLAFGAKGEKISRENEKEIDALLKKASKCSSSGESIVLNVLIGKTDFRDGSISV